MISTIFKEVYGFIAGLLFLMVMVPLNFAFLVFVTPFIGARDAMNEGDYVKAGLLVTLGSWPLWAVLLVLAKSN